MEFLFLIQNTWLSFMNSNNQQKEYTDYMKYSHDEIDNYMKFLQIYVDLVFSGVDEEEANKIAEYMVKL